MSHTVPITRRLLTPGEVAARFRVDPKTVSRWANQGKLAFVRTLGGHRRFYADEIDALVGGDQSINITVQPLSLDPRVLAQALRGIERSGGAR